MSDQLTPAEASARLETLQADSTWRTAFLAGDGPKVAEFNQLIAAAHPDQESRELEMAISGQLFESVSGQPQGHLENVAAARALREAGLDDAVIRQVLTGGPVSQVEHDAAQKQKAAMLRNPEAVARFLQKSSPEYEIMTNLNVVISAPIKSEKVA